jgi:hypothetical protein
LTSSKEYEQFKKKLLNNLNFHHLEDYNMNYDYIEENYSLLKMNLDILKKELEDEIKIKENKRKFEKDQKIQNKKLKN